MAITELILILSELVDLTVKIADIVKTGKDFSPEDKEFAKAKIREMQDKVTYWE